MFASEGFVFFVCFVGKKKSFTIASGRMRLSPTHFNALLSAVALAKAETLQRIKLCLPLTSSGLVSAAALASVFASA
jgi:hypothetical protein